MRADKYLQQIGEVPTPGDPLRGIKTKSSEAGDRGEIKEEKSVKVGKRKAREEELGKERSRLEESGLGRERITQRMVSGCFLHTIPLHTSRYLCRVKSDPD